MDRLKHTFTAGELSPLLGARLDFARYNNGCKSLLNCLVATQGPAFNRPGFMFLFDLTSIGLDTVDPELRLVPFIYDELQAYAMVIFRNTDDDYIMVFAYEDGLVLGTGDPQTFDISIVMEYNGNGAYQTSYPPSGTVGTYTATYYDADGVSTDITSSVAMAQSSGTVTFTVSGTPVPDVAGDKVKFEFEVTTPAIAVDEIVSLELPADWDIEVFDWSQSGNILYCAMGSLNPHMIRRHSHDQWDVAEQGFVGQPDEWTTDNWPERVCHHQQRLAYAANTTNRQTVWMSKAGFLNWLDFTTVLVDPLDNDAVSFTLDSGTQNKIQWLTSSKALHVGTLGSEWTVVGSTISAITPSNVLTQRHTNNGSEPNKPLNINLTTLFIERHGRVVNEYVYDYEHDSYKTNDLTILAPHLTDDYSIIDWTFQKTPNNLVWCVREDGNLIALTYQRQHKVLAWTPQNTQGYFKVITCIPDRDTRQDNVYTIVHREINSEDKYYLERLYSLKFVEETKDGRYLDSFVYYKSPYRDITDVVKDGDNLRVYLDITDLSEGDYIRITGINVSAGEDLSHLTESEVLSLTEGLINAKHEIVAVAVAISGNPAHVVITPGVSLTDIEVAASDDAEAQPLFNTITNIDHLIGMTVGIMVDGSAHADIVISEIGEGTLDDYYGEYVVGLSYESEVRPYLPEMSSREDGTNYGRVQRITSLRFDFYRTLGLYIGTNDLEDGDYEEEMNFGVDSYHEGQAFDLFTGIKNYSFMEGYDRIAEYYIKQLQPFPMIVRGVVDRFEGN